MLFRRKKVSNSVGKIGEKTQKKDHFFNKKLKKTDKLNKKKKN